MPTSAEGDGGRRGERGITREWERRGKEKKLSYYSTNIFYATYIHYFTSMYSIICYTTHRVLSYNVHYFVNPCTSRIWWYMLESRFSKALY